MSAKSPTIKRILKEASELANQPSLDYQAAPLETDLFEWHFTLRGPPAPSPFAGGIYHGRIVLPPAYPLKPPSFRFLTPTGRFEVNREICLSISGHHEETWQPAWGIRTALVAIRSFMDTDARGQLGGMEASEEVRRRFAAQSKAGRCAACAKTNEEIMREQEESVRASGGGDGGERQEVVPEELRLAYREDLGEKKGEGRATSTTGAAVELDPQGGAPGFAAQSSRPASVPTPTPTATADVSGRQQQVIHPRQDEEIPAWIDKAIYGVLCAIVVLIFKRFLA